MLGPKTRRPYRVKFPSLMVRDMVRAQKLLIDHLGIGQLKAVVGYSYGGHLTFLWGAMHPDRMRALVPVAEHAVRELRVGDEVELLLRRVGLARTGPVYHLKARKLEGA